jgi:hypothetical protein
MATPMESVGRYGGEFDRRMLYEREPRNSISNLRVVVWLVWLTASQWLTRYNGLPQRKGT